MQPFRRARSSVSPTSNIPTQSRVIVTLTPEKSFCSTENADAQEKNSGTKISEKKETQKDEKRKLHCNLTRKMHSLDLKNWPIFNLLEPDFILQIHMVLVFDNWNNKALIVTKEQNVYSLGTAYNKDNYLKTDDIYIAFYPKKIEELCGKNIKTIAHSWYFVLVLTEEGEVYSWEFKKRGSDVPVTSTPIRVAGLSEKRIVDIACGSCHSLALTSDGKVYAWGENNYGQVGNESTTIFDGSLPRLLKHALENKNVIRIACGSTFNIVLTDEYKLYGWGNNESGQILIDNTIFPVTTSSNPFGSSVNNATISINVVDSKKAKSDSQTLSTNIQSQKHFAYPREIATFILEKIVKVTCGDDHTLALTDKGKVYAWGRNICGQVGVSNELKFSGSIMVNVPEMVVDIAAYGDSSVAVGISKIIYIWGDYFSQHITAPFSTKFLRIHDAFVHSRLNAMYKPLIVSAGACEYIKELLNILESLGAAFDDPSTSDFTVQVEGQPIYVHKAILRIRCQYFKNKFEHDWKTKNDQSTSDSSTVYTVSDKFSHIVYKAFLKYLYIGMVDLPSENALDLMKLADKYCEASLKKDCGQIIKKAITALNVAFFYNKAIECNAKELEEFCFHFALCNMKAVVLSEDYIKLDMNTKDNFMRRAAEHNIFKTFA
ncbi:RCC1 and BTB domain-containing protein 1-like isoform X2 [Anoplolepis gracilipes]|uniref:RCC1 and BTB domain-containing protein 1-like isoform X2 n=1 Tax=Anoplolepis gracilipes TaxID=354296 RepID=UPI003BA389C2